MAADEESAARGRRLSLVAVAAITLGCVLAPLATVAVWTGNQISATDRYVANVAPLANDPVIQNAVADRVTAVVMQSVNVPGVLDDAVGALKLPAKVTSELEGLSAPLSSGVRDFVRSEVGKVVQSDAFAKIWVNGNRAVHQRINRLLSGDGGALLYTEGGMVSIDLGPLVAVVKQKLIDAGLSIASGIPAVNPTFELFPASDLTKVQRAYTLLNAARWVLPILTLALIAAGVCLARSHRRALIGVGLGLAGAMVLLGIGLAVGRGIYLNAASDRQLDTKVASDIFDTLTRFLRTGLWTVLAVALVIAAAGYFTGPARAATAARTVLSDAIGKIRGPASRQA